MPDPLNLGYLVPQFPGQTHIFFWREIADLERLGAVPHLLSTRPPPPGLVSHDWSDAAIARTTYLGRPTPGHALTGLLRAPWSDILRERQGGEFLKDVLICLPAARALIQNCRARGIGHVHAHSCGRAALICALARLMGGPSYSLTLHGALSDYGPGQGFKWRHASFATIITHRLMAEMRDVLGPDLPADVMVQPMGVDTEDFKRDTPYLPPAPGAPLRLFSCGRLHRVKGHQDLLSALRLLLDRGIDVQLDIAGEDDAGGTGYRAELQAHLEALGLGAHARLLGAVSGAEVRRHLLAADVFVLASWHEPLGVAYMEAMACGVPTIGTDAGGVRELIDPGESGLLVSPKSPQGLAEAIATLADDPALCARLSEAGRARVVQDFRSSQGAETLIAGANRAMARGGVSA
ncbi:exopolysaccharide biosynthesis GT4 family glycosyltransferase EpsE [Roseovarius sp. 217]|uniref:exopolysaccharide biosynthesis GT4 family glycosyltransferase EpsE n=1 Tax=Roseovarius sp. (strain 217) TaxID=314264 RepID=UPI0000684936|nr:exopolysaccharide biosynthesis GT4 family glycosyltransferase EpsE [Roseovarius sp. 217]EAQ25683.1 glycosyl transferase, group 1 family protein [Roseovarius sp. 217]